MEYLLVHRGGRGQSFVYELLYEARIGEGEGQRFLARLLDVDELRRNQSGNGEKSATGRPQAEAKSGKSRPPENAENPGNSAANATPAPQVSENANLA